MLFSENFWSILIANEINSANLFSNFATSFQVASIFETNEDVQSCIFRHLAMLLSRVVFSIAFLKQLECVRYATEYVTLLQG